MVDLIRNAFPLGDGSFRSGVSKVDALVPDYDRSELIMLLLLELFGKKTIEAAVVLVRQRNGQSDARSVMFSVLLRA